MADWRSQPAGDWLLNWRDRAMASVVVWLGAAPLGLGVLAARAFRWIIFRLHPAIFTIR